MSSQEPATHVNVRQRGSRKHASGAETPAESTAEQPQQQPQQSSSSSSSSSSQSQQARALLSPNGLDLGDRVDPAARFVGAVDQGTSSTRFVLFDRQGRIVRAAQQDLKPIYTPGQPGWTEHDPVAIMESIHACITTVLTAHPPISGSQLLALGLTNQRETSVVWDSATGRPLHNAIVWHDTRTGGVVADMIKKMGGEDHFRASCGLPLSTYFSATKIKWLLDNVPAVAEAVNNGRALAGTIDSWIIWNLTGGANSSSAVHVTDVTNASRTMLMDLESLEWSADNCVAFGIPTEILPKILSSSEIYGHVFSGPLQGVPIAGCIGDQQAAMLGQLCLQRGETKSTYGTGSFLLLNTGDQPVKSTHGLLTTVGYKLGSSPAVYALEGSVSVAGSGVQWLREQMKVIETTSEVEELASKVPDTAGTYFVPAFSGLLSPYWLPDARGVWVGLTHVSNRSHLARAVLHASAYQTREVLDAMAADMAADTAHSEHGLVSLTSLKVDGGMCASDILMQFQADQLGIPVVRPANLEATASGAAFCAGLAVNFWSGTGQLLELADTHRDVRVFTPSMAPAERAELFRGWKKAVQRSFGWAESKTTAAPPSLPALPHSGPVPVGAVAAAARCARVSPVLSHLAVLGVGVLVGCGVAAAYLGGAKTATARR